MPKLRNHAIYVADMLQAVVRILSYVDGLDFAKFSGDQRTVDAVLRNFEILGEAASHVPTGIQTLAPDIEWRRIKDFRNVVAHFYSGIDLELVWELIRNRLPSFRQALERPIEVLPSQH